MKSVLSQYGGLKRELYILFVGKLVTAMGSFVWPILTFFLTVRLGLSDSAATALLAAATIASLPAAILGGRLADRFSRKRIIIIFDLFTVTLYTIAAVLPVGYLTAAIIFAAALAQTMESPAYDALNADFSTSKQREKAYSLSYLGFNLGFIVGASVSGVLFQRHLWLAFLLNGGAILISTLLILFFVNPENAVREEGGEEQNYSVYEQPVEESRSIISVLKERPVVLGMLLISCFASYPSNVLGILLPLQLKAQLGDYGAAIYGYLNSVNGLVVILFTPLFTMVLRRFTEIPKSIMGILLFSTGYLLFSVNGAAWLPFAAMVVFTMGEVITVLGQGPYTTRRTPASHWGRIGGLSSVLYTVFSSATQLLISLALALTESNYVLLWYLFILLGLISSAVYGLMYSLDRKTFPELYFSKN